MRWEEAELDPDEFCVNCGAKIQGIYRICGFCGKVWRVKDDSGTSYEETGDGGQKHRIFGKEAG